MTIVFLGKAKDVRRAFQLFRWFDLNKIKDLDFLAGYIFGRFGVKLRVGKPA